MTYAQVLEELKVLAETNNFNYLDYMNIISQNWFSFAQWCFSYAVIWSILIFGSIALVKYIKVVVNAIKDEVEGNYYN